MKTPNAAAAANLTATPSKVDWKKLTDAEKLALVTSNARKARAAIAELCDRGALFVVSHSGGKDSQALALFIEGCVPASQIVYVHATLGRFEWNVLPHITGTVANPSELHIAQAITKDGSIKDLGSMALSRGMWASPKNRQCTSDLKRGPIAKVIRRIAKERGLSLIVECTGVRGLESPNRMRGMVQSFTFDAKNSKAGREWYNLAPIADWSTADVFAHIAANGQEPHEIYAKGMSRLSCCFCIMASKADQTIAATLNPELYAEMVAIERHIDFSLSMSQKPLTETTGVPVDETKVRRHLSVLASSAAA